LISNQALESPRLFVLFVRWWLKNPGAAAAASVDAFDANLVFIKP
jgi:hypothetical protein